MRKIIDKLRNKHFLSLAGNGVMAVLGLLQLALLYRFFSKDDVGTWLFIMTTQAMLDSIRNGFLGTATIKFYAGAAPERAREVLGSVWYLALVTTGGLMVVNTLAFLALPWIPNEQVAETIKWVGVTMLSSLPFSVIFWKLQADERYGAILWLRLVNSGSTIIAFLVLYFIGKFTLNNALLWNIITNSLTSVIGLLARLGGFGALGSRSRSAVSEVTHFGKFSLATSLSSNLLGTINTYMANFMLGPAAIAIINLPSRLMELVEIPLRSFVGTGISSMATAYNQGDMKQVSAILNKNAGILTLCFIPLTIGVFFLADIPVNLLSSGKYQGTEAANIFRIVMFTALMYPMDRFNGVALDIIHRPKVNFYKVLVMLVLRIVGNYLLVKWLASVYGFPITGFFTILGGFIYGYYQLRKY
ncbi:MAG: lipopolysaccharide biosynthesis protein, partial [Chitinophagia bacterium]|nr:lipopolysaccharide biosynthesis protein [Chitinophagia bacterium]